MKKTLFLLIFGCLFFLISCTEDFKFIENKDINFNEDSAFLYIKMQTDFGARVPNTQAHKDCAIFLENKLKSFGAIVIIQNTKLKRFDGEQLEIYNIIAQFYPEKKDRILLFSHWDTRYYADMEQDSAKRFHTVLGANDGGSGVGVLLEIARQISENEPNIGVDIIFFDAEDQGQPIYMNIYDEKAWCLGTYFWTENLHTNNYKPLYSIELDMVGGKNAEFYQEANSLFFNNKLVKKIWKIAEILSYSQFFIKAKSEPIFHDFVVISQNLKIPSIIIIENSPNKKIPYNETWHTQNDNLENIDKKSLKAVGETILELVFCL